MKILDKQLIRVANFQYLHLFTICCFDRQINNNNHSTIASKDEHMADSVAIIISNYLDKHNKTWKISAIVI